MAELSFGKIYNLPTPGNQLDVPRVSMSAMPTGTIGVAEVALSDARAIYISDNEGAREFAIWDGTYLKEYEVILGYGTGTVSIVAGNVTSAPADMSLPTGHFQPFGLKKESDALYSAYYYNGIANAIHKVSIVPGVGGTDAAILSIPMENVDKITSTIIGHRKYFLTAERWSGWEGHEIFHTNIRCRVYYVDMENGTTSQFTLFHKHGKMMNSNPGGPFPPKSSKMYGTGYYAVGGAMAAIVQTGGIPIFASGFEEVISNMSDIFTLKMCSVINGEESVFHENANASTVPGIQVGGGNYNFNDYCLNWYDMNYQAPNHHTLSWSALAFNGNSVPYKTLAEGAYLSLTPYPTLISKTTFPVVSFESSGVTKIWVNPTTGIKTTAITLPGITTIYAICTTLDALTGDVYMFADASKLLAVQPNTNTIVREWPIFPSLTSTAHVWNHGNFFVVFGQAEYEIMYVENINHSMNQMIIEMN